MRYGVVTMRRIGIRELRDTLTETVRRVREERETIEITHHGRAVAVLSPVRSSRLDQLIASGEATPGKPLDEPIRPAPVTGPMTASEALAEDRGDR